jgi:short-subunit dehydrogenase
MKKPPFKKLANQVIVITGASSGIGLATARAAAEKGARLVLAARNEEALKTIVNDITIKGGKAVYVVADVAECGDIKKISEKAIAEFGTFDTWVNDAGSSIFGLMEEVSEEDHRRLFDVNFWGIVNGSLTALEQFKRTGGTLINLGSQVSDAAIPLQGMYSASKHAVKGFTDALRLEAEKNKYPVSITLIKPAAIATPFFEHAKNYTPEAPKVPEPYYKPEEVAHAILYAATNPVRDLNVGGSGKMMNVFYEIMPRFMDSMYKKVMFKSQLSNEIRHQEGILFEAGKDGKTTAETPKKTENQSLYPYQDQPGHKRRDHGHSCLRHYRCPLS